jgi:hypothetical protein
MDLCDAKMRCPIKENLRVANCKATRSVVNIVSQVLWSGCSNWLIDCVALGFRPLLYLQSYRFLSKVKTVLATSWWLKPMECVDGLNGGHNAGPHILGMGD